VVVQLGEKWRNGGWNPPEIWSVKFKKNDISNEKTEPARTIDFLNFQNFFSIHALASYAVNVAA
jgi:hypothetical protein